jgi:hypothetical protein
MDPVLVKTMIGVLRVLAIIVAWKANISPIWLCQKKSVSIRYSGNESMKRVGN